LESAVNSLINVNHELLHLGWKAEHQMLVDLMRRLDAEIKIEIELAGLERK
jgi:hypothetical protein